MATSEGAACAQRIQGHNVNQQGSIGKAGV
jgi:hypothetical protein